MLSTFFSLLSAKRRIYLDHAAATPLAPEVWRSMQPYFTGTSANPSAIHAEGVEARRAVEHARTSVARALRVRATDVTFTSGGTEANNLALMGAVAALRAGGVPYAEIELISLRTEHPSVLKTLEHLASLGCTVAYASVREDGTLDMRQFTALLSPKTRLITIAYANSETGVVQDLARIGRMIRKYEKEQGATILFHTDASQAPLWLPCALEQLHADMMTLDAGKFCGPKGVGALIHRRRAKLAAMTHGGAQESGLRPGTENVPLVVGFAAALARAQNAYRERSERVAKVRDHGIAQLRALPGVVLNGSLTARLANNINISIPGYDTEFAVVALDAAGIACSTKSACSGAGSGISTVVDVMTGDTARASATIRLTLGEKTTKKDLDHTAGALKQHIAKMADFHT